MKHAWHITSFFILVSSLCLPVMANAQDDGTGVTATTRSNLNVRAEPSANGALLGTLAAGTMVEIHQRIQNELGELWLLIPFDDGSAWIAGWLVEIQGNIDAVPWTRLGPGTEPITPTNFERLAPEGAYEAGGLWFANLFDWMPDGRLVVAGPGRVDVFSAQGDLRETWPMPPDISDVAAHPSGDQILFTRSSNTGYTIFDYTVSSGEHAIWDQLFLPARSEPTFLSFVGHDVMWNSDGSRFLLRYSNSHSDTVTYVVNYQDHMILADYAGKCIGFYTAGQAMLCRPNHEEHVLEMVAVETGQILDRIEGFNLRHPDGQQVSEINSVLLSPDGTLAVYTARDNLQSGYIILAQTDTFEPVRELPGATFWSIQDISPDHKSLAVRDYHTGTAGLRLVDAETGTNRLHVVGTLARTKFSPDGQYLAASIDGELHIYDTATGSLVWQKEAPVLMKELGISLDGQYLIQSFSQEYPFRWVARTSLVTGASQQMLPHETQLDVAAGGHYLVGGQGNGELTLFDPVSGQIIQRIPLRNKYYWSDTLSSQDGRYILIRAYISQISQLLLIDTEVGAQIQTYTSSRDASCTPEYNNLQPFLAIHPESEVIALPNICEPGLLLWHYGTNEITSINLEVSVRFLRFMHDGTLAVLVHDNTIHFFEQEQWSEVQTQHTPYPPVTMLNDRLAFLETPDLTYVAWDIENQKLIGESLEALPYMFSPDEYFLAGYTGDQVVIYAISAE